MVAQRNAALVKSCSFFWSLAVVVTKRSCDTKKRPPFSSTPAKKSFRRQIPSSSILVDNTVQERVAARARARKDYDPPRKALSPRKGKPRRPGAASSKAPEKRPPFSSAASANSHRLKQNKATGFISIPSELMELPNGPLAPLGPVPVLTINLADLVARKAKGEAARAKAVAWAKKK